MIDRLKNLSYSRHSILSGWKFALVIVLFTAGCGREERAPENIIAQKDMVPLLTDFHLAEGYLTTLPLDSLRMVSNSYYAAVFNRHHTDSAAFHESLRYYSANPQVLNAMYKQVQATLEAGQRVEQDKIDARMQLVYQADSVRNAARLDSVFRRERDSLDYAQMQHIFFWEHPDSIRLIPDRWSLKAHRKWMGPMLRIKEDNTPPDSVRNTPAESLKSEVR